MSRKRPPFDFGEWVDETIQGSPRLQALARESAAWAAKLQREQGPLPDRVLLPLQMYAAECRYADLLARESGSLVEKREATRRRWMLMRRFRLAGLKWVAP